MIIEQHMILKLFASGIHFQKKLIRKFELIINYLQIQPLIILYSDGDDPIYIKKNVETKQKISVLHTK
jgi:hypothetical protein